MICIAAFIILGIAVLLVPVLRLFNRRIADKIIGLFKQSTYCFSRRVTLRKCDSSFKDDVKNSLLAKLVLTHPRAVKPISILIESIAVMIVIVTILSVLVVMKSSVALLAYGTCNIAHPNACVLGGGSCSIESAPIKFTQQPVQWTVQWWTEFGVALRDVPVRWKKWNAEQYWGADQARVPFYNIDGRTDAPRALEIFDPGCTMCSESYRRQKSSGWNKKYAVGALVYPIKSANGNDYLFANSELISRYIVVAQRHWDNANSGIPLSWRIIDRLFSESTEGIPNQELFNQSYSSIEASKKLHSWLKDFGLSDKQIVEFESQLQKQDISDALEFNKQIVESKIRTKKIPTSIYDGGRHQGLFEIR